MFIFPVQLTTTSRIGSLTRLTQTLAIYVRPYIQHTNVLSSSNLNLNSIKFDCILIPKQPVDPGSSVGTS